MKAAIMAALAAGTEDEAVALYNALRSFVEHGLEYTSADDPLLQAAEELLHRIDFEVARDAS